MVWALYKCFLFRVSCSLATDDILLYSLKNYTRWQPGSNPGPLGLQPNALPLSYIPFPWLQYHNCKRVQLASTLGQHFCGVKCIFATVLLICINVSKITQGDTLIRTRALSDCSWMLYHWAICPLHTDSITSLQTRSGGLSTVTMFFVPSQVFSRDWCHFPLLFQKLNKGITGFEPGTSRTAAECLTTDLYPFLMASIPWLQTCAAGVNFRSCLFCGVKRPFATVLLICINVSKMTYGDTLIRTRALSDCSWMLYHWAISPLPTGSLTSLQKRAGCSSTVTMFFVPSQVYSRDQCNFFSSLSKIIQGDTRVRTRDLSDCSRMLYHWAISLFHTDSITSLQTCEASSHSGT